MPESMQSGSTESAVMQATGWAVRLRRAGLHRGHGLLALLALAAGIWAYLVTHPLGGTAPIGQGSVRVWEVPPTTVHAVQYATPEAELRLEADWEGPEAPYVWVVSTTHPKPPPAVEGQAPPPAPPSRTLAFKGNAAAHQALKQVATLNALRDLGRLDALTPADFGLESPDTTLSLARGEGDGLELKLGRNTFGNTGRYGLFPGDGHVYLLRAAELRTLSAAPGALMDRDLLGFQAKDAERIVLVQDGFERAFVPLVEPGKWAPLPGGEEPDEEMGILVTLLDRLTVSEYAPEAVQDPALERPFLEVRVYRKGVADPVSLALFEPRDRIALARSTYTRKPVEVSGPAVRQLLEKARALLRRT